RGALMDIEFTAGTSVTVELNQDMEQGELRNRVEAYAEANPTDLPAPSVVAVGNDKRTYEVVTPNEESSEVRRAILTALDGYLDVRPAATFAGQDQPLAAALADGTVVPITSAGQRIADIAVDDVARHVGGVAVVLRDLQPPLEVEEVQRRLQQ